MNEKIKELKKNWESYILEGVLSNETQDFVKEGWDRSISLDVDYNDGYGQIISEEVLEEKLQINQKLIEIAKPIMESIIKIIKETSFSLILTDAEGVLIHVEECKSIHMKHSSLNFVLGTCWDEENVGSNSIGTALARKKDTHMTGAEHYCISHHQWTCSAALIHNSNDEIIGCLDISGSVEDGHIHTFGIVTSAAKVIEKQLDLMVSYELIDKTFNSALDGLFSIDQSFEVLRMNDKMMEIFGIRLKDINHLNIKDILKDINIEEIVFKKGKNIKRSDYVIKYNNKNIECLINISPIQVNEDITGAVIFVKEAQQVRQVVSHMAGFNATYTFGDLLTANPLFKKTIEFAKRISKTDSTILIQGESGTGKELLAHSIHNHSQRSNGPFIVINCATLPKNIVESELFGYEKGSFTDGLKDGKPGKFELASNGTIFLDEIGELPLEIQSKLLRVLEDKKIARIGSSIQRPLNIRIIVATNRNLKKEIKLKQFREDLFYRLDEINLNLIPLRERQEDILLLADYFLEEINKTNPSDQKYFSDNFKDALLLKEWRGNIRELRNFIRKSYYQFSGQKIKISKSSSIPNKIELDIKNNSLEDVEKSHIIEALKETSGNVVEASGYLKIGKSTLYRKVKKYNIDLKVYK